MKESDNLLSPSGFHFNIEREKRLTLLCQKVQLPDIALSYMEQEANVSVPLPSDRLIFSPLAVEFLLDDNIANYRYIYDWMIKVTRTNNSHLSEVSNGTILVFNRKNTVTQSIWFRGLTPASLSGINFDFSNDEVRQTCSALFEYTEFGFE